MSMIVTTVTPNGIVMGADSACSMLTVIDMQSLLGGDIGKALQNAFGNNIYNEIGNTLGTHLTSRTVQKLYVMKVDKIAFSTGNELYTRNTGKCLTPYLNHFCLNNHFENPETAARALLEYVTGIDRTMKSVFHVCGYNVTDDEIPMPEFWYVDVLNNEVKEVASHGTGGVCYSGANDYFSPYGQAINEKLVYYTLQDAIDVTMFVFELGMKLDRFIRLEERIAPPIDVLAITQAGIEWVSMKKLEA